MTRPRFLIGITLVEALVGFAVAAMVLGLLWGLFLGADRATAQISRVTSRFSTLGLLHERLTWDLVCASPPELTGRTIDQCVLDGGASLVLTSAGAKNGTHTVRYHFDAARRVLTRDGHPLPLGPLTGNFEMSDTSLKVHFRNESVGSESTLTLPLPPPLAGMQGWALDAVTL